MRKNQNPVAGDDGVLKIDAGEHHHNSPPPVTLQISRLASRFGLPIATATVFAEIIFHTESRG